jgi:toxin HigB-1
MDLQASRAGDLVACRRFSTAASSPDGLPFPELQVKGFAGMERSARLKLDRLEAAGSILDLTALSGNRFEAVKGDRKGQYSVRINDQWRICFEWPEKSLGPVNIEITDYH